jgi:hypothetical protein
MESESSDIHPLTLSDFEIPPSSSDSDGPHQRRKVERDSASNGSRALVQQNGREIKEDEQGKGPSQSGIEKSKQNRTGKPALVGQKRTRQSDRSQGLEEEEGMRHADEASGSGSSQRKGADVRRAFSHSGSDAGSVGSRGLGGVSLSQKTYALSDRLQGLEDEEGMRHADEESGNDGSQRKEMDLKGAISDSRSIRRQEGCSRASEPGSVGSRDVKTDSEAQKEGEIHGEKDMSESGGSQKKGIRSSKEILSHSGSHHSPVRCSEEPLTMGFVSDGSRGFKESVGPAPGKKHGYVDEEEEEGSGDNVALLSIPSDPSDGFRKPNEDE